MAWKRCDDYDGSTDDVKAVSFGFDGNIYLVHMGVLSRKRFEEALQPWVENQPAHRPMPTITDGDPETSRPAITKKAAAVSGKQRRATRPDMAEIRVWAIKEGKAVGTAGRLSNEVIAEYDARPV